MAQQGSSYISTHDLASLDLSNDTQLVSRFEDPAKTTGANATSQSVPSQRTDSDTRSVNTTATSTTSTSTTTKRVLFCPLALVRECAQDGEKDPCLVQSKRLDSRGRPRLQVRTYSVDAPNLSSATSRAWKNVCTGLSSSIQALSSPTYGSASYRRDSSPEREYEKSSFQRSRAYSDPKDDPYFIPNSNKINIKLPAWTRKCCPGAGAGAGTSPPVKSCLKSPSSMTSSLPPLSPGSPITEDQSVSSVSTTDQPSTPVTNSTATSEPFPQLAPVSSAPQTLLLATSPSRQATIPPLSPTTSTPSTSITTQPEVVPLSSCCLKCHNGTEMGLKDDHVEKWTKAAKKKHRRDSIGQQSSIESYVNQIDSTGQRANLNEEKGSEGQLCLNVVDSDQGPVKCGLSIGETCSRANKGGFESVVVDELGRDKRKTAKQEFQDREEDSNEEKSEETVDDAHEAVGDQHATANQSAAAVEALDQAAPLKSSPAATATSSTNSPCNTKMIAPKSTMSPPQTTSSMARSSSFRDSTSRSNTPSNHHQTPSTTTPTEKKRKFSLSGRNLLEASKGALEMGFKSSLAGAAAVGGSRAFS
ncbi:hypothetical protein OIO90_001847 [Microbotryomycetes sp. JL221]|nr:hypothetical protein OIO90_001847 [Microbotryomycetes sp. JL221]